MTPDDIERAFIIEFSVFGNQIGKSKSKAERRERVRQAIYINDRMNDKFQETEMSYCDAFRLAYGERLDRRAATRVLPDDEGDEAL